MNPSVPSWFPPISDPHPVPVARSIAEMAEATFRAQDLQTRQEAEADKTRQRTRADALQALTDEAECAAFMGRPHMSALEYYALASEAADRAEAADRKRREKLRAEAAERRVAELEAELAESRTRSERLGRDFSRANEGWGRARDEAERFRRSYYR